MLLDIRTEKGSKALNELIRWADVITINAPASSLESLGLSPQQILVAAEGKLVKPVLLHFDAWSGPLGSISAPAGRRANAVGYDDCKFSALLILSLLLAWPQFC